MGCKEKQQIIKEETQKRIKVKKKIRINELRNGYKTKQKRNTV